MVQAIEQHGAASGDSGARTALADLQNLMVSGEAVVATAIQHRIYALVHRRRLAAATTGRFIFLSRRLLGGFDPTVIRWQDLKEVKITVGMFTATLTIDYSANMSDSATDNAAFQTFSASGLKKIQAQALYRECQAQEQSWREKRRVRSMEEMRARSGGAQIATGVFSPGGGVPEHAAEPLSASAPSESPTQRLTRAKEMLAAGLITDSEFEAIKAKIVGGL